MIYDLRSHQISTQLNTYSMADFVCMDGKNFMDNSTIECSAHSYAMHQVEIDYEKCQMIFGSLGNC